MYPCVLILFSTFVFRFSVRRDYMSKGRLSLLSSALELLVFILIMCYPFLYNSPGWDWFWSESAPVGSEAWYVCMVVIAAGFILAFGTMIWFGIRRAFGLQVSQLVQSGPYRFSRNPQVLGGYLLILGSSLLWQSWYNLAWIGLYAAAAHMMVVTEEEHLAKAYGEEFASYCQRTSRYLGYRK